MPLLAFSLLIAPKLRPQSTPEDGLVYYLRDFWDVHGDKKLKDFPFLDGPPWTLMSVIICYLYVVIAVYSRLDRKQLNVTGLRPNRPLLVLLNGSQLGLNGACFLIGAFLSSFGQNYLNHAQGNQIKADQQSSDFVDQLRVHYCAIFVLFKLSSIGLSLIGAYAAKRRVLSSVDIFENCSLPFVVYLLVKFKCYDLVIAIALLNCTVNFLNCTYHTLVAAKILTTFPHYTWERFLLSIKCVEYLTFYFMTIYQLAINHYTIPTIIKLINVFCTAAMNLIAWASFGIEIVEDPN